MDNIDEPLGEEEAQQLAEEVAAMIVKRRLETPAVLFLEMHKPLSFIASQGMIVAMPFLAPLLGPEKVSKFSRFLRERENIERLIQRIEELSEERDLAKKEDAQK
ncbi:MAG: hypothetical protein ABFD64_03385 [Armatimonadota bacterium]